MFHSLSWLTVLTISGAYVAFLIGAGFATGQEAMQFYVAYGWYGLAGVAISLILLIYTATSFLNAGKHYQLRTNEDTFRHFCGPILGVMLTWYTMIMIIAVYAVMLAGLAATLHQAYDLPVYAGAVLMSILSMVTLLLGLNKIIEVMGVIGPVIALLTITIAAVSLYQNFPDLSIGAANAPNLEILKASPNWFFSGCVYVGLILPGMASFLPRIGAATKVDGEIRAAAILGPVFFMGTMALVILALISNIDAVYQEEVPIMALANSVMPLYGSVFAIVIFFGIYTTITPLLWTVCARFSEEHTPRYRILVVSLTAIGLMGSTVLPFGQLLNVIYPSIGYVGLLILICQITTDVRATRIAQR
jgi:uncharacterized membrane protein YkvI